MEEMSGKYEKQEQVSVVMSEDPTTAYLKSLDHIHLLSHEQEITLMKKIEKNNQEAFQTMVESNLRLVVKIAKKYQGRGVAFLDLVEEGNIGLMHAIEKYDYRKGFRISTYATWWIRQYVERAIMHQSRMVRLPVHVIKELNTCLRAKRALSQEWGRSPTIEELAEHVKKPLKDVKKLMDLQFDSVSMNQPLAGGEDEGNILEDVIEDERHTTPQSSCESWERTTEVSDWVHCLDAQEREIIECRFGLSGRDPETLDHLGERLGIRREKVRSIQIKALAKLRRMADNHQVSPGDFGDEGM